MRRAQPRQGRGDPGDQVLRRHSIEVAVVGEDRVVDDHGDRLPVGLQCGDASPVPVDEHVSIAGVDGRTGLGPCGDECFPADGQQRQSHPICTNGGQQLFPFRVVGLWLGAFGGVERVGRDLVDGQLQDSVGAAGGDGRHSTDESGTFGRCLAYGGGGNVGGVSAGELGEAVRGLTLPGGLSGPAWHAGGGRFCH